MVDQANFIASEHVQVMTVEPDFFLKNMKTTVLYFLVLKQMFHTVIKLSALTILYQLEKQQGLLVDFGW